MNLKYYLLLRITLVVALCLVATVAYNLYQHNRQSQQQTRKIADALDKQLELQLLRIDAGFQGPEHFPDLDLWKETHSVSGI
jgi:cytochrome c-type biogenesis protein CcmH/NrfG